MRFPRCPRERERAKFEAIDLVGPCPLRKNAIVRVALVACSFCLVMSASGCLLLFHDPEGAGGAGADSTTNDEGSTVTASSSASASTGESCGDGMGSCVPPLPDGFLGPFVLVDGPSCPEGSLALAGGDAFDDAECACAPIDTFCTQVTLAVYDKSNCTSTNAYQTTMLPVNMCFSAQSASSAYQSGKIMQQSTAVIGSCQGSTDLPQPFTNPHSLCEIVVGDGCAVGQSCLPAGSLACVYGPQGETCTGGYPIAHPFVSGTAMCSCSSVPSINCDAVFKQFTDNTCMTPVAGGGGGSGCHTLTEPSTDVYVAGVVAQDPSCALGSPLPLEDDPVVCCTE